MAPQACRHIETPRVTSRGYKRQRGGHLKNDLDAPSSPLAPTSHDSTWDTSSDSDSDIAPPKRQAEEHGSSSNAFIRNWLTPHTKPVRHSPFRTWRQQRAHNLDVRALSQAQLRRLNHDRLLEICKSMGYTTGQLSSLRKPELVERIALHARNNQGVNPPKPLVQPRLVIEGGTLGLSFAHGSGRPVFQRSPHSRRLRRFESPSKGRSPHKNPFDHTKLIPPSGSLEPLKESDWSDQPGSESPAESNSSLSSLSEAPDSPTLNAQIPEPAVPIHRSRKQESNIIIAASKSTQTKFTEGLSPALLGRRRRHSLHGMCVARGINARQDCTKAELIAALLGEPGAEKRATESEDLNGLDLESLQLLDHEIPPENLEKIERIGTGGFKDVYLGRYHVSRTRSIKVAISDIRNEITDMDLKELRLLRDLRHENIVHFIGVSIPPPPRLVPCMIITELCINGDLFDYIRNTPPPPDSEIVSRCLPVHFTAAYCQGSRIPT